MNFVKKHSLIIFLIFTISSFSQEVKNDSITYKDVYGFRFGIDVSNPVRTFFDNDRKSLELVADYRINKKIYAAIELGFLDKTTKEDYLDYNTIGEYFKVGANYNLYENWLDMDNEAYVGLRYGFSTFKQTLYSYSVFSDVVLPSIQNTTPREYAGLNANWAELVFGIKVETFKNVFLGASFSFKKIINTKEPENFKNLYIPGFDRVFLNNGGFGFNYTIAYRLPLYKKNKVDIDKEEVNKDESLPDSK